MALRSPHTRYLYSYSYRYKIAQAIPKAKPGHFFAHLPQSEVVCLLLHKWLHICLEFFQSKKVLDDDDFVNFFFCLNG